MKAIILLILAAGVSRAASLSALTLTVPPAFEENRGQSPTAFRYVLGHLTMGFGCDGVYGGRTPLRPPSEIRFVDARTSCSAEASESDGTFTRFYRGGESIGPLPRYRVLRFRDVWPGVSLEYRANDSSLTARFELRTAADLRVIRLSAQSILPGSNTISTNLGVWRISASQGNEVAVSARLDSLGVHFLAPAANPSLPMTLTMEVPVTIPTWSTRVFAAPQAIADAAGNWYFAGTTTVYSEADENSSICIEGGLTNHCPDAFVAMFDSKGAFRYAVYLLGSRYEQTGSIRTDLDGNIYVAGWTYSRDFPTTVGAIQTQYQGPDEMRPVSRVYRGGDGFVAKIHGPTGGLIYSTLIGGKGEDTIQSLAVDTSGQTYLSMNSNMADLPLAGEAVTSAPHCCGRLMSISEDGSRIR
ncbi:MAG: SBBP repeat-containing protein, partial [Bryobacterales bacterium]|nr:SBBP repeat-containing protein [Bryobacterales bacterium]